MPLQTKRTHQISLITTAVALAVSVPAFLATDKQMVDARQPSNPVVTKHITEAKRLVKKGRWKDAEAIYKNWATAENPEALLGYALLISRGRLEEPNLEKARELLLVAVQQQFAQRGRAAFELARLYAKSAGQDCPRLAFEWLIKAVQWGYAKAHIDLAKYYSKGFGVNRDEDRAIYHYRVAAQKGSASALLAVVRSAIAKGQTQLGGRPLSGIKHEVLANLHEEARSGRASSEKTLGRLYLSGELVDQDPVIAKVWLRRAAHAADPGAMVDYALTLLVDGQKPTVRSAAINWLQRAAATGHGGAHAHLGRLYIVDNNLTQGLTHLRAGIALRHPGSMHEMAKLHLAGALENSSRFEAIKLATHATRLGHAGARLLLKKLSKKATAKTQSRSSKPKPRSAVLLTGATITKR